MERKDVLLLISLDLTVAFDTVDHAVLLKVLHNYFGIGQISLEWFESYLDNRYFKVCIGTSYLSLKKLLFSIPQGSHGGSGLYNCYLATIVEIILHGIDVNAFADDHALETNFKPGTVNEHEKVKLAETCITKIGDWMDTNRLKMNLDKTEIILFGSSQQLAKVETSALNVHGKIVDKSQCIKYLGAHLDEVLSFKVHARTKCKTAIWNIMKIQNIRKYLDRDTCELLIYLMVISHIDNANGLLAGATELLLGVYQRIQNFAAKAASNGSKHSHSTKCLNELHWLLVKARIEFKIVLIIYKCLNGNTPKYLKDLLVLNKLSGYNL